MLKRNEKYKFVFLTNIPAFYKISLYNKINEREKIFVIFLNGGSIERNPDFYKGERKFDYVELNGRCKIFKYLKLLAKLKYENLVIGGWNEWAYWLSAFLSPRKNNALVSESSYFESSTSNIKSWFKRLFLHRITKAYCPGKSNAELMKRLHFKKEIIITNGVGLYRREAQPVYEGYSKVKRFLCVARLIKQKNLEFIIDIFNIHPELELTIIGFGILEKELKARSGVNIHFLGAIDNDLMSFYYREHDVFVLPSFSEPWGLVAEEALNNGLPVLLSDRVGCADSLVENNNVGLIFKCNDKIDFEKKLKKILDIKFYNKLRYNVSMLDFSAREIKQISSYR